MIFPQVSNRNIFISFHYSTIHKICNYIFNMICTLQHNWNVLTSIYNIVAPLCASVTKMQIFFFFIGNPKDAQVAVRQTYMYITCKFIVIQVCPLNPLQKHDWSGERIWFSCFFFFSSTIIFRSSESKASVWYA